MQFSESALIQGHASIVSFVDIAFLVAIGDIKSYEVTKSCKVLFSVNTL
jgi:hypothetical protein